MLTKVVSANLVLLLVGEGLAQQHGDMPVIDLGYSRHQALSFNVSHL